VSPQVLPQVLPLVLLVLLVWLWLPLAEFGRLVVELVMAWQ
jgi:hypothetical protein